MKFLKHFSDTVASAGAGKPFSLGRMVAFRKIVDNPIRQNDKFLDFSV